MGAAREVATEGVGRAGRLRFFLLRSSSGGDVVCGGDVGAIGSTVADVRGSACGFPATGNKAKGKADDGRVVAEGDGGNSTLGRRDTAALDLLGWETCDSGGVGGPTGYFQSF